MHGLVSTWEQERYNRYRFPIVVDSDFKYIALVYPLMQEQVNKIYVAVKNDKRIKSAVLFGSSITIRCNHNSDIDIAITLNDNSIAAKNGVSEDIQILCDWNADIIWSDMITEEDRIFEDIERGLPLK